MIGNFASSDTSAFHFRIFANIFTNVHFLPEFQNLVIFAKTKD